MELVLRHVPLPEAGVGCEHHALVALLRFAQRLLSALALRYVSIDRIACNLSAAAHDRRSEDGNLQAGTILTAAYALGVVHLALSKIGAQQCSLGHHLGGHDH